jgi:hypothetical protein
MVARPHRPARLAAGSNLTSRSSPGIAENGGHWRAAIIIAVIVATVLLVLRII